MPSGVHNGRRGRPPQPLAIALAKGNPLAQDSIKRVPLIPEWQPKTHGMPDCPLYVNDNAKKYWDTICNTLFAVNLVAPSDMVSMTTLFDAFGNWLSVKEQLERDKKNPACLSPENGYLMINQQGNRIINPTMNLYWQAWDRVLKCCCLFGMTPSSRAGMATMTLKTDRDTKKNKKRFFEETIDASLSENENDDEV